MKISKIIYWIATILICGIFLYSATMYLVKTEMVEGFFESLQYPTYLILPLAIAKILAVLTILIRFNSSITEWAYAGLFFDILLASAAHYKTGHGVGLSVYAIPILFVSYFLGKKIR